MKFSQIPITCQFHGDRLRELGDSTIKLNIINQSINQSINQTHKQTIFSDDLT